MSVEQAQHYRRLADRERDRAEGAKPADRWAIFHLAAAMDRLADAYERVAEVTSTPPVELEPSG